MPKNRLFLECAVVTLIVLTCLVFGFQSTASAGATIDDTLRQLTSLDPSFAHAKEAVDAYGLETFPVIPDRMGSALANAFPISAEDGVTSAERTAMAATDRAIQSVASDFLPIQGTKWNFLLLDSGYNLLDHYDVIAFDATVSSVNGILCLAAAMVAYDANGSILEALSGLVIYDSGNGMFASQFQRSDGSFYNFGFILDDDHTFLCVGIRQKMTSSGTVTEQLNLLGTRFDPIKAQFEGAPLSGTSPLTVQFTDLSEGLVGPRHWYFGDGSDSTETDPTHTYTAAGTYTVTLEVSNSLGVSDDEIKTAYITVSEAQGTVSGTVTTEIAGYPDLAVKNATASLKGTTFTTTTDVNGHFELGGVSAGDYTLLITAPLFQNVELDIHLSAGQQLVVTGIPSLPVAGQENFDVDGDGKTGLAEALHVLRIVSGFQD